jgi:hypothetical protein
MTLNPTDSRIHVAGLATIKIASQRESPEGYLDILGYTQDGAYISFQPFFQDVPGDENGGDAGPPVDQVWMGEVAQVQLDLMKRLREYSGRATLTDSTKLGQRATAGTLTFGNAFCLLIDAPYQKLCFPVAVPNQAQQINLGTKFSRWSVVFSCYKNSAANGGILYQDQTAAGVVSYIGP